MIKYLCLIFVGLFLSIHAQSVYFIKYKDSVPVARIESVINSKTLLGNSKIPEKSIQSNITRLFSNAAKNGAEPLKRIVRIELPISLTEADFSALLPNPEEIEYIESLKKYTIDNSVNDSLFAQQWSLQKINAVQAWNTTSGSDSVIIGVIDTGIDFNHPDIADQLFRNPGENGVDNLGRQKSANGIDDDNNGFVDDYMGWDFTDRVGFPYDSTGGDYLGWDNIPLDENIFSHGTAVAGIIAAKANNTLGIAGVAHGTRILNLRAFDPDGNGEEDDVAAAIVYAVNMGAKVLNMSFGDNTFSYVLRDVIRYAYANNVVMVASSGNSGSKAPHYPSGYDEVISVGNSTPEDYVSSQSNYGSTLDLVAPGTGIITLRKGYGYSEFSGTSAAAPFVSATAGLILSRQNFANEEVKQILKTTADDIGESGWDERSASGRLNTEKALRVLAPSKIGFDYPYQDFATAYDTLKASFTVLSPYFASCTVYWGAGLNPTSWNVLSKDLSSQGSRIPLPVINLSSFNDTTFTLRIEVRLTDDRTIEERINFHRITVPSLAALNPIIPAYYGSSVTLSASLYTTQRAIAKMYYREKGTGEFRSNSLDGFTVNNMFVKQLHYGFVPQGILKEQTDYEVYFEIENMLGYRTIIKDSIGNNFIATTGKGISNAPVTIMPYTLPNGTVFKDPSAITSAAGTDILLGKSNDASKTHIYSLESGNFVIRDSISQRIPKDVGDFNNDGKMDILANWGRSGYILSQQSVFQSKFSDVFKNESDAFWPILVKDIDGDNKKELLAVLSDTSIGVYRVNTDFSLTPLTTLKNFSTSVFGANIFDYPHALVTDVDKNGKNEIWVADREGDVLCYNVNSSSEIVPDTIRSFRTQFLTSSSYLAAGDFNGDNTTDIAVILHSLDEIDIAKFYLVYVVTFSGNKLSALFVSTFIDPASEFNVFTRKAYNSLRFGKFFSKDKDDLLLCLFPYSYGFSYTGLEDTPVFFRENINTNAIIAGDFNNNGLMEFGIAQNEGIRFYEAISGNIPNTPANLKGYSVSANSVYLQWKNETNKYRIYRSVANGTRVLIDSCFTGNYLDTNVIVGSNYEYHIVAVSSAGEVSQPSVAISVYHHLPTVVENVFVSGRNNVTVQFTERIKTVATELGAFSLSNGAGDVIPAQTIVATGQKSLLINFPANTPIGTYKFKLHGFNDYYNSPVKDTSFTVQFNDIPVDSLFYVTSFSLLEPHRIEINFNLTPDSTTAVQVANYRFEPENFIETITLNKEKKQIVVQLKNMRPLGANGYETTLYLSGIRAVNAEGGITIKSNTAGSVLVFSKNASDIENVYVYPNPVSIHKHEKMTFANLPKYADIQIFAPDGKRIKTLIENDGNGGIPWDLRDESGTLIQSGIYFFRIRQLNDGNEEQSVKLYKFAVIR